MKIFKPFKLTFKTPHIISFVDGKVIRIEDIPDCAFSHKMIGDGIAIQTSSRDIFAPCDGTVSVIAATRHAFIITRDDGAEILIHIGLNKIKPDPNQFKYHINVGDKVNQNTSILTLSKEIMDLNHEVIIPIVLLNHKEHPIRTLTTLTHIKKGKTLFTYK